MHFNIYLDEATGQKLTTVAQQAGQTRNALIRKAISEWLERQTQAQWPEIVADFQGLPDMAPFEAGRSHLRPPAEDPLA